MMKISLAALLALGLAASAAGACEYQKSKETAQSAAPVTASTPQTPIPADATRKEVAEAPAPSTPKTN